MERIGKAGQILDDAVAVERRDYRAGYIASGQQGLERVERSLSALERDFLDRSPIVLRVGPDDLEYVREKALRNEDRVLFLRAGASAKGSLWTSLSLEAEHRKG